jgi:outer membrane protein assembly factor BamB
MMRAMHRIRTPLLTFLLAIGLFAVLPEAPAGQRPGKAPAKAASAAAAGSDWLELRGPNRDGTSPEKNLPDKWSLNGENLLWTAPYGGISAPVTHFDHVYYFAQTGAGPTRQETLVCLDANTGKLLWKQSINPYHSDVPPHRVAWASPAVDPATGHVYVHAANGILAAFTREGKPLWRRYLTEDFGMITTHGGRTVSPAVEDGLVIVNGVTFAWGDQSRGASRVYAFDKTNGMLVWQANPGGRPTDTVYAPPFIREVNGAKILFIGLSDGAVHALKLRTGELVWQMMVSKRGLNTGVIAVGDDIIITHSEENMETSEMGMLAAVDAALRGTLKLNQARWMHFGFQGGFSSPVSDGQTIYQIDNGALMAAFDASNGRQLWTKKLGTIQKASAALADGKIYVGTESGKFYILRPSAAGCEVLSEVTLGNPADPDAIVGGAAIARGRIYFATKNTLYAIGRKGSRVPAWTPQPAGTMNGLRGQPAYVQVVPAEVVLNPGEAAKFEVRLFDSNGSRILGAPAQAQWSLEQLSGAMAPDGTFTAPAENKGQAGKIRAAVGALQGEARVRVIPPLPWNEDFSSYAVGALPAWWVNATNKYAVKEIDGNKVLTKLADNTFSFIKRARTYSGPVEWADYTVECDIRFQQRRRQMGDAGVSAQGYQLVIFANQDRLELQSWQPETERTVVKPFTARPDTWYRLKLRVENLADGRVRARGKVWLAAEAEPAEWSVERTDAAGFGITHGSPGVYGDAMAEIYYDHLKVYKNQ